MTQLSQTSQNQTSQRYETDIKQLNSFLQDEKAAVETYQQCVEKMDDAEVASELVALQKSHQQRVSLLSSKVRELGGTPEAKSGLWGNFAKLVEGSAKAFGKKTALSALEEGEDRGRDNYESKTKELSPECQSFINSTILPEQRRSHDELNRIIKTIH